MAVAIGIDVGGTAIKGGIVSSSGKVLEKRSLTTEAESGLDHVLDRLGGMIQSLAQLARSMDGGLKGVGLGVPGIVRHADGVVLAAPNLSGWEGAPVAARVRAAAGLPVVVENDANAAALAENHCGAGVGAQSLVLLTLGTGIGSGLVLGGRLWRGTADGAGELGHMIVEIAGRPCTCGQRGCLETYASAYATARRARELIEKGEGSWLKQALDRGDRITSELVAEGVQRGDPVATRVWEESSRYLAMACINIQRTLAPERIVIAGGMSAAGDLLLDPIVRAVKHLNSTQLAPAPTLKIAALGNDAGFIGAALSALRDG